MTEQTNHKSRQPQIVAQWITSLAISVICCAVLFVVFAGYIVDMHASINMLTVRSDMLEERLQLTQTELREIKRAPLVQFNGLSPVQAQTQGQPVATEAPAPTAATPAPSAPTLAEKVVEDKEQGIVVQDDGVGAAGELLPGEDGIDKVLSDKGGVPPRTVSPVPTPSFVPTPGKTN